MTAAVRASIRAAPWSASRKAVSCAMTSSAQAMRVVASWPMRTTLPLVPYVPLNWLQPANPATLPIPNTTSSSVPGRTATTEPGAFEYESTTQRPSSGFSGAASNTRRVSLPGP